MQLKLRRSQREGGVISKNVIFCLDARTEFTTQEYDSIRRYKLGGEIIYSSQAAERYAARGDAQDKSIMGNLKAIGNYAMARLSLNVTVGSLANGQHIECKSLDELLEAEEAIMTACQNLKAYLNAAETFDGREVLIDFSDAGPVAVAQAVAPQPALAMAVPAMTIPPITSPPLPPPVTAEFSAMPPEAVLRPGAYQAGRTFRSYFDPGPAGDQQMKNVLIAGAVILVLMLIATCAS